MTNNVFRFYAHKLVLVKNSEVFERMLSQQWNAGEKKVTRCLLAVPFHFIFVIAKLS